MSDKTHLMNRRTFLAMAGGVTVLGLSSAALGQSLTPEEILALSDEDLTDHLRNQFAPSDTILRPGADVVVAFGDSLTQGFGVNRRMTYPAQFGKMVGMDIINAGRNGETSRQALSRIEPMLRRYKPTWVIICIGGNDLLRGLPPEVMRENIGMMISSIRGAGAHPVVIAIPRPGDQEDHPAYEQVAEKFRVPVLFGLGRRLDPSRHFLQDGIHPNADGYTIIAEALVEFFRP